MKLVKHTAVILAALFVTLGMPALYYHTAGTLFAGGGADSVTGASQAVPDQPLGRFVVLMDQEKHPDTLKAWSDFFSGRPTNVIMEDLSCMTVQGDAAGLQLAERYQANLVENQMSIRSENPILVASRAENGLFDVIILSQETAETYHFDTIYEDRNVAVIPVKGAPQ